MGRMTTTLGGLQCRIVDHLASGQAPALAVVLCHGFGASGDDLVPLADEILRRNPGLEPRVRFVFPAAPLTLPGPFNDARAWWPLDMEQIERSISSGSRHELHDMVPEGLSKSRRMLRALLDELSRTSGLPMSRIVLGGFSQGAMLATDVTLRLEEAPAALCVMSGTLLMAREWTRLAPMRRGLPVLQSHGHTDELLPYPAALMLRDLLEKAGLEVEFVPFDEGHTIPATMIERLGRLLERLSTGDS